MRWLNIIKFSVNYSRVDAILNLTVWSFSKSQKPELKFKCKNNGL